MNTRIKNRFGFTLMELVMTILLSGIMVAAVGLVMIDSHRGWLDSYAKVHGGAADDAAMTSAAFERVVRKASCNRYELAGLDDLTVYYYSDWQTSKDLDAYGRFYRSKDAPEELYWETGRLDPQGIDSTVCLSRNVTNLEFRPFSGGIEMILQLDDGRETTTLVSSAILHNE